jgi:glutamate-ammonia-ligase adenylyltransferase
MATPGLLVSRFAAYADYQQQRGSNTAWTWEHQADDAGTLRHRQPRTASAFRSRAHQRHLRARATTHALRRGNTRHARTACAPAHPTKGQVFDVKHSPGGMVDIEFAVQFLVLAHSQTHPALRANSGNIALLQAAQNAGLLGDAIGENAANAYRALRQVQHSTRLNEEPTHWDWQESSEARAAGLALWAAVFGAKAI